MCHVMFVSPTELTTYKQMVDRTPAEMLAETIVPHLLKGVELCSGQDQVRGTPLNFFPSEFVLVSPVSLHKSCSVI
jgi:hypothetical protein